MAATSDTTKKGKKKKGQKVNLNDFLASSSGGTNDGKQVVTLRSTSWADTMDEMDDEDNGFPATAQQIALPTAPRAARQEIDISQIPDKPPYTAYVGNLSYDVDEDALANYFVKLQVNDVRLVRDQGRMKGYGYVEFGDKQSLVDALGLNGETFLMRKIKVDLATQNNGRDGDGFGAERDGKRNGNQISGEGDADDDWRGSAAASKPNYESAPRYGGSAGYDRGGFGGRRERGHDDNDGGYRSRNGAPADSESSGSWSRNQPTSSGGYHDDRDGQQYNRSQRNYDDGPLRRGYDNDYNSPRRGYDRQMNYGRSDGAGTYGDTREGGQHVRQSAVEHSKERPRLQLAPRSKPIEADSKPASNAPSVFGSAKPVDTTARDREIEERLNRDQDSHQMSRHETMADNKSSSFSSRDIRQNVERRVYGGSDNSDMKAQSSSVVSGEKSVNKPTSSSIFGSAKPVDTAAREREIEEKLLRHSLKEKSLEDRSEHQEQPRSSAWSRGAPKSGSAADGTHNNQVTRKERRERPVPQSIEEMPKYNESGGVDLSIQNKYAGLLDSDENDQD